MKRLLALTAAAVLSVSLLAGCGSDSGSSSTGDYCDSLKSAKAQIDDLDAGDFSTFDKTVDKFHELADQAPDEVQADWQTLSDAVDTILEALDKAGLDPKDLDGLSSGTLPDGVDPAALQQLATDMSKVGEGTQDAADNISKHAKSECDIDLES